VSVLSAVLSFLAFVEAGSGQLPLATEVPDVSAMEPADKAAGAAAEKARAAAKVAAAAIFFNI
jgi:Na+-transporting methylmalonyl-CoA/oxaloacetate decarboxylase gamma subunit